MIPSDRPDASTLAREAEAWAAELMHGAEWGRFAHLSPADAERIASLLSSLASITRAAGART